MRDGAGPALVISFILLGGVCGLAALCYAELASMIPQAGSAYAYSYATLGELIAWIIGWDLILEYAVGNIAVAVAWSGYFNSLLSGFGITCRMADARLPRGLLSSDPAVHALLESAPRIAGIPLLVNLPAFAIVMAITWLLLLGVQGERPGQQHHGGHQAARARPLRHRRRDAHRHGQLRAVRAQRLARASIRARRSSSSPTSASTPSRRPPRRPRIRSATCRSASSAGWPSAR